MALCVLVALVFSAMLWSAWCVVRVLDTRMQERWVAQQTVEADLWARMLSARIEAHQRLLNAIAQGVHTSLLDKPEVLDALMQQEGSMLRLFESVHVALPSGAISHHGAVGQRVTMDAAGGDALRRTITEGKPMVVMAQAPADVQHLRVLLTVPIRRADGGVSGALAAMVKLPLAALLPETAMSEPRLQYMLLDSSGLVLVHSDNTQRWKNVRDVLHAHWRDWQLLSQPSTANADTAIWDGMGVTRVGLPLPQWQVVVVRDMAADMALQQGLPLQTWGALLAGGMVLTLLAAGLLWGWLAPWPKKSHVWRGVHTPSDDRGAGTLEPEDATEAPPAAASTEGVVALFEALPSAMMLEVEGRITMTTPQFGVMLGYFGTDAEALTLQQLLHQPESFAQVRSALEDFGSFEGAVQLRKKDGDGVWVQAAAWTPSQLPSATVWRLRMPWRQRRAIPFPEAESAWRDELTGLPNREAFVWGLQSWVTDSVKAAKAAANDRSASKPMQGCLLFADLDHLGMMNEVTSREMGNKVLRHVGRLLANYTQPLGSVARLGGDEFAVLLPGISLAHAQGIGQTLCDAVWRWQPSWSGERHWVSISIGIVAVDAQRHTPEQALRAADMACYEAKRRGRCQVAAGPINVQPSREV